MKIKIGQYELENDMDCKCVPDGYEIFASAVERQGISPNDFTSADWGMGGSIIVTEE